MKLEVVQGLQQLTVFTLIKEPAHCILLTQVTLLKEIGVNYTGGIAAGKTYLIIGGEKREVPGDYSSVSYAKNDGSLGESDGSQFLNSLAKIDFSQLENVTVQEWLDKNIIHDKNVAEIVKTIVRLDIYANDPDIQSIGSALRQIYVASRAGNMYLDGGWQTLVDGLLTIAKNANARIVWVKKQQR
jgi:Prenylcysteine lyase